MSIETNLTPLIKYPGGKSSEIPTIEKYLPNDFDAYIEPFVGGGAAGAFLLVDRENGITAYYSQHLLNSPNAKLRKTILGPTITDCVLGRNTQDIHISNVSEDTLSKYL